MRVPCCAPDAQHEAPAAPTVAIAADSEARPAEDMVLIAVLCMNVLMMSDGAASALLAQWALQGRQGSTA